jgi:hypothetical protein
MLMDELEQRLKSMPLATPSVELDRRLDEMFLLARRRRERSRKMVFYWGLVAAVGGAALVFLMPLRRAPAAPHPVVYRIEAQGRMRQMLLNSAADRDEPPRFVLRVITM